MKKLIILSIVLIFALILPACGSEEPPQEQPVPVPDVEPTLPPAPATATLLPPPVVSESGDGELDAPAPAEAMPEGPPTLPPWPTADFGYGIQSHATIGDPAFTAEVIKNQLGLDWIKVQLEWSLVQPEPDIYQWFFYDGIVDEASKRGLYLMFSVVGSPEWARAAGGHNGPPDDYGHYAQFLTALLEQYPDQVHSIEVWNEQNLDREWTTANGISPEDYVAFLQTAHGAIKAADSDVIVISGALAPTGGGDWVRWADDFEYLDRALAAGMLTYADCVGVHHNGYNIGPDVAFDQTGAVAEAGTAVFRGPFDNIHHSWSFKTTLDTYAAKIQAVDPNKKLCVTEFGWASSEGYDQYPTGFEFAQDNTLDEQAQYIVQAYQQMRESGDVWLTFLFNFDFGNKGNGPTDDPVPYSIVDTKGIPRPAFGEIAAMEKTR
ncbi:MAG: hypothetical protein GY803_31295 [Chloroflexi bacterium]|nr:hypothetical protein [Chloroflexota bacterium]